MAEVQRHVEAIESIHFLEKEFEKEKCFESAIKKNKKIGKMIDDSLCVSSCDYLEGDRMSKMRRKKSIGIKSNKEAKERKDLSSNISISSCETFADKEAIEEVDTSDIEEGKKLFSKIKCKKNEVITSKSNKIVSSLIAMLQGVEVLCSLSIMYLYKDDFKMDPALLAIVLGALRIPWTVKPIWAIMSDAIPLFGFRRKSYIFVGALMCLASTLGMGTFGFYYMWTTTSLLFLYFLGSAVCNVIGEALVVEAGRSDTDIDGAAKTVSIFFAFRKLSFAVMSYLSGFLLNYIQKQYVFLIATILPVSVLISTFWLVEPKVEISPMKTQLKKLLNVVKTPVLLNSTLFIFLMMCTPSAGAVMFYFMTGELKFGPELLGRMALLQSIASLCGIIVYMYFFSKTCIRKLLLFSTIIITPFCLLPIVVVQRWNLSMNIPDTAFVVTDTVLMEFVGEFQAMPILVLAARLCPPGLESTIYSFLLSAYNLGLGISSLISAGLTAVFGITATKFNYLSIMILVCAFTNLLPLAIIWLIPHSIPSIDTALLTTPFSQVSNKNVNKKVSNEFDDDEEKKNASKDYYQENESDEEEGSTTGSEEGKGSPVIVERSNSDNFENTKNSERFKNNDNNYASLLRHSDFGSNDEFKTKEGEKIQYDDDISETSDTNMFQQIINKRNNIKNNKNILETEDERNETRDKNTAGSGECGD